MASDFSSGCTEAVDVLDEKEEGEISLEDVSSSEEGHLNYGCNSRNIEQCPGCSSSQHCASWCTIAARSNCSRALHKKDAVQEKENRRLVKGTGYSGGRHASSTLQEKNDDLIPISSDSDMELVGLMDSTHRAKSSKVKKKRKKRRPRASSLQVEDESAVPTEILENVTLSKRNPSSSKENRLLKAHHKEKSPSYKTESSPRRHRSSPDRVRSLGKKKRSPAAHTTSTAPTKSPRRLKSPGRFPHRVLANPLYKKARKHSSPSRFASSPTSDVRVTRLLKKVRQLEMVGTLESDKVSNKTKEHGSSLKEKLNNILKATPENNENATNQTKEDSSEKKTENGEEEEDLNILRQKALETKQSKTNKSQESLNVESDIKGSSNNEDDDDEDLKLRLIALRSAVYKKHHNRVQRRAKSPKRKKDLPPRTESPFSESFINNVPVAEDDESPLGSPQTSPRISSAMKDCMSLEDMELDSDLERNLNLDEAPYSPTDEVNSKLILEAEQLGIDATDVSLININSQVPTRFSSPLASTEREVSPPIGNIYCSSNYSLNSDFRYPNSQSTLSCESPSKDPQGRIFNEERPYSPSDAPVYDPDLTESLLPQNEALNSSSTVALKFVNNLGVNNNNLHSSVLHPVELLEIDKVNLSMSSDLNLMSHSTVNSLIPNDTMITLDDLPETDIDGSPLVPMEKDSSTHYNIPEHLSYQMLQPSYQPLYLRNITDNVNKIPTLFNKSLIPPPVSRVSKQLRQEPKKPTVSVKVKEAESVFTSSSMQSLPMDVESSNSGMHFKANKLNPIVKNQVENLVVFDQFRKDSVPVINENKKDNQRIREKISENTHEEESPANSSRKKKKIRRRKRRSSKRRLNESEGIEGSEDLLNEKPVKSLRTLETESRSNEKVLTKNVETLNKSKDNKVGKTNVEHNLEQNLEINEQSQKDSRVYDPHNNNITIIRNSHKVLNSTTNEKEIDGKLSLSKNDLKNKVTNEGSRRRSIDEDEEALRAILLASMAKRTKTSETSTSSTTAKVSEISTASEAVNILETSTASKAAKVSEISTASKAAKFSEISTASKAAKVSETATMTISNKTAPNIIQRQTTSLPTAPKKTTETAPKKTISLNSSAASGTKVPPAKVPVNSSEAVNLILGKRRSISVPNTASPRKMVKRTVIPASTKVVNNAKRYQNSLMQKRLNLQKANMAFNAKRIIANRSLRVLNHNQNTRSNSPNVSTSAEGERFIISLNSDSETDSESERRNANVAVAKKSSVEKCPPLKIPTTEFERSVDQFLREVRKKQESAAATKQPTNPTLAKKLPPETSTKGGKAVTLPTTPLAVRHLPASQQEEYHRLKQQILEREKLKLQRTSSSQQTSDTNTVTPSGPLSPSGPTASSKQKAVSVVVTNSLPKTLLATKTSSDNQPSISQEKSNLSIQIRNDGASPNKVSARNPPNTQNSVQGNIQELPKQVMLPKLRILTCEQVNMKFQIQVKQKEDGRKVIVGDNSPENNMSFPLKKSEVPNQNNTQRETIRIQNSIANESLITTKAVNLEASAINESKSSESDKTYDSQASTVVFLSNNTTGSSENRVNKTIDSEASTVVLSQSNSTLNSENNATISSAATAINGSLQKTPVGFGKEKEISTETPERGSIPPAATSTILKEPIVLEEATVTKETTIRKEGTIRKEATIRKKDTVREEATISKELAVTKAIVSRESIISKEPTVAKESIVVKKPTVAKESTVTKKLTVTEEPTVIKPTVTKEPTVSIKPTVTVSVPKALTVSKPSIDPKPQTVSKPPVISKSMTVSKLLVNSAVETSVNLFKSTKPAHKENSSSITRGVSKPEEKSVTQKTSKSADKEKCHEVWDGIKNDVQSEVEKILKLGEEEQKKKLVKTEQELVAKRYVVLDDLAEVSGSLRQWELEKDLQANLLAEVKKLREQLREAEKRLQEQKDRVTTMGSKVSTVHEKMNIGRKECFKLSKICTGLGSRIFGSKYKVPEAGVQLVNNRLKEVAQHTSQLCKKKSEKKRKSSESTEKANKKEEAALDEQEKPNGSIERQNSYESVVSCGRESNSESMGSSEIAADQHEIENSQEDSSQKESESVETQSLSSNSNDLPQLIVDEGQKEKKKEVSCEKTENNKNTDSSSRKENSESDNTCHKSGNSTQNQSNKADKQSSKQSVRPYVSILTHMRTLRSSRPDGILCPYQLMGSCHDAECQFIHHPSH